MIIDGWRKGLVIKVIIAIVPEVVLRMTIRLVVGALLRIIHRGLIVTIRCRHVLDIVALAGHLVFTVQIAVQADLFSVVADWVILRVSFRYRRPLAGQT